MWERFTYYGMRSVLILFLVGAVSGGGLGFDDQTASSVYGLYICATYLFALLGGWIADRLIGPQRAVIAGSVLIFAGNAMLAFGGVSLFFMGLLVIVLGVGLLKPNISVMVAQLYPEGGSRRDAGFSIFYMGISVGAVLGSFLVPLCAARYGWRIGFSLPALGMIAGLGNFLLTRKHLAERDIPMCTNTGAWLPVIVVLVALAGVAGLAVTGRLQINPAAVSAAASWLLGLLSGGTLVMVVASQWVVAGHKVSPAWLLFTYLLQECGDLCLSPVGLSSMTKLAPPRYVSQVMGVWFLALALGNNLAGQLSRQYDAANLQSLPALFLEILWWSVGAAIVMFSLARPLQRLLQGRQETPAPSSNTTL
jgi:dipeptide/tripeptide permease